MSEVIVSASSRAATRAVRTRVTDISNDDDALEWNQLDEALPLPFNFDNELMNFVLRVSDLAAYDHEMLKVDGLAPGQYRLKIDKQDVGTFTAEQLAQGINLALLKTPMWNEARDYDGALGRRSTLEDANFYIFAETDMPDKATASRVLREGQEAFEAKAQEVLRIPVHHYLLTRAAAGK